MLKVLIVEDNPADAFLIKEYVDPIQFMVTHVDCLTGAISILSEGFSPDAILLDLGLPESSGIETLRALKQYTSVIPIIVISGLKDENTSIAAIREGAQDYIVKDDAQSRMVNKTLQFAIERHKRVDMERKLKISQEELLEAKNKISNLLSSLDLTKSSKESINLDVNVGSTKSGNYDVIIKAKEMGSE